EDPTESAGRTAVVEPVPNEPATTPVVASSGLRTSMRKSIPEQFNKPWDFRFTREQALYEMNVASAFAGPLRRLWHGIKRLFAGKGELRKWQALLYGKNLDEQLWGARPPRGSLERPEVREWARRTLEMAKYDPSQGLLEWEVFWRRKGV